MSVIAVGDLFATGASILALWAVARVLGLTHLTHPLALGLDTVVGISPQLAAFATALALGATGNYFRRSREKAAFNRMRGAALMALMFSWMVIPTRGALVAAGIFAITFPLYWVLLSITRQLTREWATRFSSPEKLAVPALIVGGRWWGRVPGEEAFAVSDRDYRVLGYVSTGLRAGEGALGALEDLGEIIAEMRAEAVIIPTQLSEAELAFVYDVCASAGCECLYSVRTIRLAGESTRLVWRGEEPFFEFGAPYLRAQELLWKRCVDITVGSLLLLLVAPLMALVAIGIKLDSRGPVFFRQDRAGLGGRRFRMLKFRTMRMGADAEKARFAHLNHTGDPRLFKIPDDPRITRFGRLLRRWSLDELPQIWNVVRGDMSLVGPRPFFESDLEDYEAHHFRRLGAKPGITGLWQVSGRSSVVDFEEVVRLDREYIEQWSPFMDFKILLMTFPAVLRRRGAF